MDQIKSRDQFAENKLDIDEMAFAAFDMVQNIVGKGENAFTSISSFPIMFFFVLFPTIFMPASKDQGAYCFTVVHLSVRLSVCTNLTFSHYS